MIKRQIAVKELLQKWREVVVQEKLFEMEEEVNFERGMKVKRKVVRMWRMIGRLRKAGDVVERKVRRVMFGFPFF